MNHQRQQISFNKALLLSFLVALCSSCYQYRVLNTNNDPSTEYREATMHAYGWGLWNKPQNLIVPNCDNSNAIDEITMSKSTGQSLLTWITLGFVSTVKVRWKCHKPCERVDSL